MEQPIEVVQNAPTNAPIVTPNAPAQVQPASPAPAPAPDPLQNPQVLAAIEKARAEEKRKLYGDLEKAQSEAKELKQKVTTLEKSQQQQQIPTGESTPDPQVVQLTDQISQLTAAFQQSRAEAAAERLAAQRAQILREREVPALVEHLVVGNSPETLAAAADFAKAEYAHYQVHFAAQMQAQQPAQAPVVVQQPQQPMTAPVVAFAPTALPASVASVAPVVTNPAPAPAPAGVTPLDIQAMTSPEAVRSGAFAAMRAQLHQSLRTGFTTVPTQLPMRSFPQAAPPAPPVQMPYMTTAPAPTQQYVAQPGGVMQPMGLPTPPVVPQGMALPAPGAPFVPQPGAVPTPSPGAFMSPDVATARQMAADAAARAMHHPASAAASAATTTPVQQHAEYQLPRGATPPVSAAQLASGVQNPMIRNG